MIELGLSRVSRLIAASHNWKAVHIAGTNGKGSVAAYIAALFQQSGLRVGKFTSPHLIDRWDCISLNQRVVDKTAFLEAERDVSVRARQAAEASGETATEFERLTATAFELFDRNDVEVGVIECGLGGLRDATNVLTAQDVLCSVITKIGLDHQEFLGDTIEKIATEKAGIFKQGVPAVIDASNDPNVKTVLRQQSEDAKVATFDEDPDLGLSKDTEQRILDLPQHQQENFSTGLRAYRQATRILTSTHPRGQERKTPLKEPDLRLVLEDVQRSEKGRLQWLSIETLIPRTKPVLLDGAHNVQSARALADYLSSTVRTGGKGVTWVLAMKDGKDKRSILSTLLRREDNIVATTFGPVDGMPWVNCTSALDLAEAASKTSDVAAFTEPDQIKALCKAAEVAGQDGPMVIAGSLYLVSDILRLLRKASLHG